MTFKKEHRFFSVWLLPDTAKVLRLLLTWWRIGKNPVPYMTILIHMWNLGIRPHPQATSFIAWHMGSRYEIDCQLPALQDDHLNLYMTLHRVPSYLLTLIKQPYMRLSPEFCVIHGLRMCQACHGWPKMFPDTIVSVILDRKHNA